MALVLSTAWNAYRYNTAEALVFEIKSLGFQEIELSFNLTPLMVKDIERLVKSSQIKVSSLHNFCPIPEGIAREQALPDCFSMASLDEEERQRAIKQTQNTIDTAARLGARVVILHSGRVEIPDETRRLIDLYHNQQKDSPEFFSIKEALIKNRAHAAKAFLDQALRSIDELNAYARKENILLGIENRFYYREIPSYEELGIILQKFYGSQIHYWHDVGHAQVMENLGFTRHKEYLDAYSQALIGMHLHDLIGCQDHQAPLKGTFDFKNLTAYVRPQTMKVLEVHHRATAQDLQEGKKFLEGIFNGKD